MLKPTTIVIVVLGVVAIFQIRRLATKDDIHGLQRDIHGVQSGIAKLGECVNKPRHD